MVKIVVEYVVNSVKILGKDVEGLTNGCEVEECHGAAHHRSEGRGVEPARGIETHSKEPEAAANLSRRDLKKSMISICRQKAINIILNAFSAAGISLQRN